MDTPLLSTIILGVTGICLTAYYSWHSNSIAHAQMLKQLFTEFNKRYDDLNNYLVEIELEKLTFEKLNSDDENCKFLKQKVIDYFSLCAEEYFWYFHKKRIEPLIWKSWQSGMKYWYEKVPAIKALWQK